MSFPCPRQLLDFVGCCLIATMGSGEYRPCGGEQPGRALRRTTLGWLLLLIPLCLALAAGALGAGGESRAARSVNDSSDDPAVREATERELARVRRTKEQRATPEQKAERRRSRTAFGKASRAEALEILKRERRELITPSDAGLKLQDGERIEKYLSDFSAQVATDDGGRAFVESFSSMRATDESGRKAPIDLKLRRDGDDYVPTNALAATRVSPDLRAGVRLPESRISLRPLVPTASEAILVAGEKVFFPNVDTDTDFLVAPKTAGVETYSLLRSAESPETHVLSFDLPQGAVLRAAEGTAADEGSAEIVQGGKRLAIVSAPAAWDADGEAVPMTSTVRSGRLEMNVRHRAGDFRYPITVDPEVSNYFFFYSWGDQNWESWYGYEDHWGFEELRGNQPAVNWGNGLYVKAPTGINFPGGVSGQWSYPAYPNTTITRVDSSAINHQPAGVTGQPYFGTFVRTYLWNGSGRDVEATLGTNTNTYNGYRYTCWSDSCNPEADWSGAPEGNYFVFNFQIYGAGYRVRNGWAKLGDARVWLDDYRRPSVQYVNPSLSSGDWVGNEARSGEINTADEGLGVLNVSLDKGAQGTESHRARVPGGYPNAGAECAGHRDARCPGWWQTGFSYSTSALPEGTTRMRAYADDASGNPSDSTAQNWDVRVDRSAPGLGQASGSLWDARDQSISGDDYSVQVPASDPYSGVKYRQLLVDGEVADSAGECDGCHAGDTLTWRPGTLSGANRRWTDGEHRLQVKVYDRTVRPQANMAATAEWKVIVDRDPPSVDPVEHTGLPSGWFDTATPSARVVAHDRGAGVKRSSVETVSGGSRQTGREEQCAGTVPSRCPTDPAADNFTYNRTGNLLPQGIVSLRARAEDASSPAKAGYSAATWTARVDHTPPVSSEPTGTLMAGRDGAATAATPTLRVEATDNPAATADPPPAEQARSGVASIRVSVDGQTRPEWTKLAVCAPGGCPMREALDITFAPGQLADGRHEVEIVTKDQLGGQAGHTDTDSFSVLVDRNAPSGVSAEQRDLPSGWINDDARPKTRIVAEDLGTGVKSVGIDGRFSGSLRPPGEVDWTGPTKTYDCAGTVLSPCPRTASQGRETRVLRPASGQGDDYSGVKGYDNAAPHEEQSPSAPPSPAQIDDPIEQGATVDWYFSDHLELVGPDTSASVALADAPIAAGERVTSIRAWALTGHWVGTVDDGYIDPGSQHRLELYDTVNGRSLARWEGSSDDAWRSLEHAIPAGQTLTQQELNGLQLRLGGTGALVYAAYVEVTTEPSAPELTYNEPGGLLPEGILTLRAFARDATEPSREGASSAWQVKVDRSRPEVSITGTLKDKQDQYLYDPAYQLHVDANDRSTSGPRAGVDRIELLVDDEIEGLPVRQPCLASMDSCSLSADFVFLADQHEEGIHTVTVRVTDRAGNVTHSSWDLFVDRTRRSLEDQDRPSYEVERLRVPVDRTLPAETLTFLDEEGLHTETVRAGSGSYDGADGVAVERDNTLLPLARSIATRATTTRSSSRETPPVRFALRPTAPSSTSISWTRLARRRPWGTASAIPMPCRA